MMPMVRWFVMVLLLGGSGVAAATIEGTYWDPNFVGEGWTFESQNDIAFITWYTYEDDGSPTFRTGVANLSYAGNSIFGVITVMSGELFRTTDRTNTESLGDLSITFVITDGVPVGMVNAAGVERTLVPFDFNFANDVDRLHGYWSLAELSTLLTDATTLLFDSSVSSLQDGRPARGFTTVAGLTGYAYYEAEFRAFVFIFEQGNGNLIVSVLSVTDDKALGEAVDTDGQFNVLSPTRFVIASSITRTEGETQHLAPVLQIDIPTNKSRGSWPAVPLNRLARWIRSDR